MRYMGGKSRIAKHIVPIMERVRLPGQLWVEPFVGGGATLEVAVDPRLASDINPYVTALLKAARDGWQPPKEVSHDQYEMVRDNPDLFAPEFVGFVALGCTFGAKWWGGYARGKRANGTPRDYCDEARRNILAQAPKLANVEFMSGSYDALPLPKGEHLIYCDPPYKGCTQYRDRGFDHRRFWYWCEDRVAEGHKVFVSEYQCHLPNNWVSVWSGHVHDPLRNQVDRKSLMRPSFAKPVEHLFAHKKYAKECAL